MIAFYKTKPKQGDEILMCVPFSPTEDNEQIRLNKTEGFQIVQERAAELGMGTCLTILDSYYPKAILATRKTSL